MRWDEEAAHLCFNIRLCDSTEPMLCDKVSLLDVWDSTIVCLSYDLLYTLHGWRVYKRTPTLVKALFSSCMPPIKMPSYHCPLFLSSLVLLLVLSPSSAAARQSQIASSGTVPSTTNGPPQEDTLLHQFTGAWDGYGKLFGNEATFTMQWEWVLERQFIRLVFQNKIEREGRIAHKLDAQAYYKPIGAAQLEGTWFDSRGMVLPLQGSIEHHTLTMIWGTPETEQGRTVYRLLDRNRIEVEDFVWRNDQWDQFGHALYKRSDAP